VQQNDRASTAVTFQTETLRQAPRRGHNLFSRFGESCAALGYAGAYTAVKRYVAAHRPENGQSRIAAAVSFRLYNLLYNL
jgi:hypothetical protein